ncbi:MULTISPECIES: SAM-dependent methyltransferase [unclassified Streptomyces]|uniref:SAM-dependent methyltransferase n=1 Tax=unclassified Streptomyces TaxID=2593676 RepID=UPI0037F9870A|nr:SAM-dependent methyltransferase [Streptomyces sp. NBC_01176]
MERDVSGIDAIGRTAFAVATLRAAEHRTPHSLFTDPYAERFLRAAGDVLGPRHRAQAFVALMRTQAVVRTRFFDDHLRSAAERGCRQVVLVASGMDSRPWRLEWPAGTTVFDVDQEPVLRFKNTVMEDHAGPDTATRRAVPADLRKGWAARLRSEGFRDDLPTAWLIEGLLYSLDEQACDRLLATVSGLSSPGSTLAFDHFEVGPSLRAATDRISPGLTRLWQTGPTDPAAWLHRHGWRPDLHELADVAARFGRTPHPAYTPGPQAEGRSWLAAATLA